MTTPKKSEAKVSQEIELEAPKHGVTLWRNNVGVATDHSGRPVRYGLCNKSPQQNKEFKSADYIGVTPIVITQEMVGKTIGVFTSIEAKRFPWTYTGKGREGPQNKWRLLVESLGGIAMFANSADDIWYK